MATSFLQQLFLGNAKCQSQDAASVFRTVTANDREQLQPALRELALAVQETAPFDFRKQFESGYRKMDRVIRSREDISSPSTLIQARDHLAQLLETLPDEIWKNTVMRFGNVSEVEKLLPRICTIPQYIIHASDRNLEERIESIVEPLFQTMLSTSAIADTDKASHSFDFHIWETSLLEADQVIFKVKKLPIDESVGLQIQCTHKNRLPIIYIHVRDDCPLPPILLAASLARSSWNGVHGTSGKVSWSAEILLNGEYKNSHLVKSFERRTIDHPDFPYRASVLMMQQSLLERRGRDEIEKYLVGKRISQKGKKELEILLNLYQLRVCFIPFQGEEKVSKVTVRIRDGDFTLAPEDLRRENTAFFNFHLPHAFLKQAQPKHLWGLLVHTLISMAEKGIKFYTDYDLPVKKYYGRIGDKSEVVLSMEKIEIPSKNPEFLSLREQYRLLFQWLAYLCKQKSDNFPIPFINRLQKIRWVPLEEEVKITFVKPDHFLEEQGWTAVVEVPPNQFFRWEPIKWIELLETSLDRISLHEGTRYQWREDEPILLSDMMTRFKESEKWSWIKLFWQYKNLPEPSPSIGQLTFIGGEKAKSVQNHLTKAILYFLPINQEKTEDFLSDHPFWIIDFLDSNESKERMKSTRVSFLSKSNAVLIHFNGEPEFDIEEWRQIVQLIFRSPEGLTWFDLNPNHSTRTNRPELMIEEGAENWYSLNPKYKEALPADKDAYQAALDLFRNYAQKEGKNIPLPTTSVRDLERLYSNLLHVYHPDKNQGKQEAELKELQDITRNLMEAFTILLKFH